jgi:hypothetical protein
MTDLDRCDAEQVAILNDPAVFAGRVPAWAVVMTIEDWNVERRMIEEESAT